jgi:hypothetical protein
VRSGLEASTPSLGSRVPSALEGLPLLLGIAAFDDGDTDDRRGDTGA